MRAYFFVVSLLGSGAFGWAAHDLADGQDALRCRMQLQALQEWVAGQGTEPGSPWRRM